MTTSTNPFIPLIQDFLRSITEVMEEAVKMQIRLIWDGLIMPGLKEHWLLIVGTIFLVFVILTLKAMMGRWGSLGSFLYNLFYFGILLVIGLIWGPEVLVSDFFSAACTAILYPACYLLVGYIIDRMGLRRRRFR